MTFSYYNSNQPEAVTITCIANSTQLVAVKAATAQTSIKSSIKKSRSMARHALSIQSSNFGGMLGAGLILLGGGALLANSMAKGYAQVVTKAYTPLLDAVVKSATVAVL